MRKKKLLYNTISSLIFQITTIICGFILPRLILNTFGSEVNGVVNSITQFLGIISFLELGVGSVVQSSLYDPLAKKNQLEVNKILTSANKFFRTIGFILLTYVIGLVIIFPQIVNRNFNFIYTATLIIAISISSFAQYFFGIVNRLLLNADQRGYIQYTAQTVAVIGNTIACFLLIYMGATIQVVKLVTSIIYLVQPLAIYLYVHNHYHINMHTHYDDEPIKQKWNGIAQHLAAVILDGTDTIVLTLFASLSDVSIYSVYFLVVKGVKQLFMSMTTGITALIGELWVKKELDELKATFSWVEWIIHTSTTLVFGITAFTIVPFIRVYTSGINDANYIQPVFALLMTIANAIYCLRLPYNIMILAAGHYKQTQKCYIIAAVLNIVISITLVKLFGLVGVVLGTLTAMIYQTFWMAAYDSQNLLRISLKGFLKQCLVDTITFLMMFFFTNFLVLKQVNYKSWIYFAIKVGLICTVLSTLINIVFYRKKMRKLLRKMF